MATDNGDLVSRYGPWALITGGSEGVGRSWAEALAARGLNLVLMARRPDVLERTASDVRKLGVDVRTVTVDITSPSLIETLDAVTCDVEIGLVVHNVGSFERDHGWFLDDAPAASMGTIEVNCVAPTMLAHHYGRAMCDRGRGGFVLMGSLAGIAGQPLEATYSAAKAFTQHLAEALWAEFGERGVDVVCVPLGGTRTPALEAKGLLGVMDLPTADEVVAEAIEHLADGPVFVPVEANRRFFDRVTALDRRAATETMARLAYKALGKPS